MDVLPGPPGRYAAMLRYHCNTEMSADEIHDMGRQEVQRIMGKMTNVMSVTIQNT